MEGRAAGGTDIDLEEYGRLTDRLGRCLQRLGLKRQARDLDMIEEYAATIDETSDGI
jgi:hypothetical protein